MILGLCKPQQTKVEEAIQKAKDMGLIDLPRYYPQRRSKMAPEPTE